jgi:hypothetical protein
MKNIITKYLNEREAGIKEIKRPERGEGKRRGEVKDLWGSKITFLCR